MSSYAGLLPEFSDAQGPDRAFVSGIVTDPSGAVVRGAAAHLTLADAAAFAGEQEDDTDSGGEFSFSAKAGKYVLTVEAPGFATYTSAPLSLKPSANLRIPVRLSIASLYQRVDVPDEDGESGDHTGHAGAIVFDGDKLKLLSDDSLTLQQQLNAMAGGFGQPSFLIDGFSGGRLPPKSSIRSIRINENIFSANFSEPGFARVEISTKPGTDRLHGQVQLSGTDQPWDARNPYANTQPPFYDFEQDGNLNGPLNRKTSFFASEFTESLANSSVVNAADPQDASATISTVQPAPQKTQTYSLRVDRQFSPVNFGYIRDEWSQNHITNSGIVPLVLPSAAYSLNTLTNALQLSDTQVLGAHAVNETRFQYLRTRVRRDPNSTLPSIIVQGSFQDGGSPSQFLRDNQDAYELQDIFEFDRGHHSFRTGLRFRGLRDANESGEGTNGQYIFPDAASFFTPQPTPTQYSQTVGQQGAVLSTDDLGLYFEDDWKATADLTLSYGLRFETQTAIPDHSDPAPRVGFAWAIRPGKSKEPIVTLRGGYGIFYDRFPAAQLLQSVRQNGTREIAYLQKNPGFNPLGSPSGFCPSASQPTTYQVDPRLKTSYSHLALLSVIRSLGRFGSVSTNVSYTHDTHNYLTENINAPLPGTFDPSNPFSGIRPLGTAANVYQFSSAANGNAGHFYIQYQLQLSRKLFAFGYLNTQRSLGETDGITSFPSNQYNLREDYSRTATDRTVEYTGGFMWTLPFGVQLMPFLAAHTGDPFDIITGADANGDTIYNDRPALASSSTGASIVRTAFGNFDVAPLAGQGLIPRNHGTAPGYVWPQLRVSKDFHLGPRPQSSASALDGKPAPLPDRPWDLSFTVEVHNLTNHNNPGLPVGMISAQPCGVLGSGCACPASEASCGLTPSHFFGHSLSLAGDFSPITASNRTVLLQTSFSW